MSEAITTNVAAAVATEIKFKDELRTVGDKSKELFRLHADAATGTITIPADKALDLVGITEAEYKKVREGTDLLNNAFTLAGSEIAVELMKENKTLQSVQVHVPLWKKDTYEGTFKRTGTSRNPGNGVVTPYVGAIGVGRINVTSTRTDSEWKAIKSNMRALAEAAGLDQE